MSTYEYRAPITRLRCDREGCTTEFQSPGLFNRRQGRATRNEAAERGWDVPPPFGKGSRRDTDFCPEHAGGAA